MPGDGVWREENFLWLPAGQTGRSKQHPSEFGKAKISFAVLSMCRPLVSMPSYCDVYFLILRSVYSSPAGAHGDYDISMSCIYHVGIPVSLAICNLQKNIFSSRTSSWLVMLDLKPYMYFFIFFNYNIA